jgi:hypothetical protein
MTVRRSDSEFVNKGQLASWGFLPIELGK